MRQTTDDRVRYMISPDAWPAISPMQKAVRMRKRLRRRKMNTRWTLSLQTYGPIRRPSHGMLFIFAPAATAWARRAEELASAAHGSADRAESC
eukprot:4697746-Prymnesium_polylepis.1